MGRSYRVHVVGTSALVDGEQRLWYAMNTLEMNWQRIRAEREGQPITGWYAQTSTGERMLGGTSCEGTPAIKLVPCPICDGSGLLGVTNFIVHGQQLRQGCPVCDGTGQTKPGYWRKWQDRQLDEMRKERAEYARQTEDAIR